MIDCIDIIIVNWNSGTLLSECIKSIDLCCSEMSLNIIVVDNNSHDCSPDGIECLHRLTIIRNEKNVGFGAACNQGILASTSQYILFLNPDTRVLEGTLQKTLLLYKSNPQIGFLGVQQINKNGQILRTCSREPKLINYFYDSLGLSKLLPSVFYHSTLMNDWNHESSTIVDQVMGAFLFISREKLDLVGLFDERFFVYYEDADISLRMKTIGYPSFYYTGAKIFHHVGGTSQNVKDLRLFYSLKSRIQFFQKHHGNVQFFISIFSVLTVEFLSRILFCILRGQAKSLIQTVKGYRLLFIWLFRSVK